MIGEIIAIGDELTSGRITNTTSGHAARELFRLGHRIRAMHTIGDDPQLIGATLTAALERADFLIITGGLGATTDDLTSQAVIDALHLQAAVHPGVKSALAARWPREKLGDAVSLDKLSLLPEGAEVMDPEYRMAGYRLRHGGKPIFLLPGVPPQMETLLATTVIPELMTEQGAAAVPVCQQLYRSCGLKEVEINKRLLPLEADGRVQIGYYPVGSEVHVSVLIRDIPRGMEDPLFVETDRRIRQALGSDLYAVGDQSLAATVGRLLTSRGLMLAAAESCTGGLIGATLTEAAGSSQWFAGGVVAYANTVKHSLLGVDPELIARHGAVSGEVARAMASGAAERLQADIAVAATGIAGPDGGTADKPVGTVYLGLCYAGEVSARQFQFTGSRRQVREKTAHMALDMVRRALLEH